MELSYLLFTGSLSGLVSILGHSVTWSLVEFVRKRNPNERSMQVQISEAFLHMLCGVTLGFVFWASWGLIAIVQIAWWVRGLVFGGLAAALLIFALVNVLSAARLDGKLAALLGSRWLTTCVLTGLTCAWSWDNGG